MEFGYHSTGTIPEYLYLYLISTLGRELLWSNIKSISGFAGKNAFEAAWVDALGDQHKDYITEIKPFLAVAHGYGEGDREKMQKDVAEPAISKYYGILERRAKVSKPADISKMPSLPCRARFKHFPHCVVNNYIFPGQRL